MQSLDELAYGSGVSSQRQVAYYERTASTYADQHINPGDGNFIALEYMAGMMHALSVRSALDIGAGTGRALNFLSKRVPQVTVFGVEPVEALLRQVPNERSVLQGVAEHLPFPDQSVDAVTATALMHHVREPAKVIDEMMRVARRAIFVSDANRFGQGPMVERWLKFVLWRLGLWKSYVSLRTKGRGSFYSDGDGEFYSYSVFDSIPSLAKWATQIFVIPTGGIGRRWCGALFGAPSAMIVAVREPPTDWAGL